jgi:hypothetical protein
MSAFGKCERRQSLVLRNSSSKLAKTTTMDVNLMVETSGKLASIWDELGVNSDDRARALEKLSIDVAALYSSRVHDEIARRDHIIQEISQLLITLENMQRTMNEVVTVVSIKGDRHSIVQSRKFRLLTLFYDFFFIFQPIRGSKALLEYRDALENVRVSLQEVCEKAVNNRCIYRHR